MIHAIRIFRKKPLFLKNLPFFLILGPSKVDIYISSGNVGGFFGGSIICRGGKQFLVYGGVGCAFPQVTAFYSTVPEICPVAVARRVAAKKTPYCPYYQKWFLVAIL